MNKLVVITGGTKGIGRALVEKFASEGFDIATCARKKLDLEELSTSIKTLYPTIKLHGVQADLSTKEACHSFTHFIGTLNQKVEVLINNTGVYTPGQLHNEEDGVLEHMINTNVYSAYRISRALLPAMIASLHGTIFNICSTASITPYINGGSYCISKYALLGMTKVLREEMKPYAIKVTAVLPGATKTASWEGVDLPDERFIKAEDVAKAIYSVYTLSPNAVVEELLIRPQLGDLG